MIDPIKELDDVRWSLERATGYMWLPEDEYQACLASITKIDKIKEHIHASR